jgi:hypothetical protein
MTRIGRFRQGFRYYWLTLAFNSKHVENIRQCWRRYFIGGMISELKAIESWPRYNMQNFS